MKHNHFRRRLSLALPAFVFFSFALAETVEVGAVAKTLLSLSPALAGEQSVRDQPPLRTEGAFAVKTCKPTRKGASEA